MAPLVLQALFWSALTAAFAALLVLAGPQSWDNALRFSALNWMPWAVLAPAVFWFSGRFPLERGHLWRSVPAHVLVCGLCVGASLWVATDFEFMPQPRSRADAVPALERPAAEREGSRRAATPAVREDSARGASATAARTERTDRAARIQARESLARRGPSWWPSLGAALLRANFDAAVYLIVVVAAHALAFYRRAQERERHAIALSAGLNRAKLDALRLQLQPHFLFNALNAISTLVHRDAKAADELIGDLGELLRLSLQTAEHEVPLAREFDLLERYLAIEQARLGDRLRVVRDVDPAALDAMVPTFVLQPLVENAIRHGVEPRLAPGTVTIRARRIGDRVHLTVNDDGVGLFASRRSGGGRGIGVSNTEARLHALHGESAKLVLSAAARGGVDVQIVLPYSVKPRGDAAPAT